MRCRVFACSDHTGKHYKAGVIKLIGARRQSQKLVARLNINAGIVKLSLVNRLNIAFKRLVGCEVNEYIIKQIAVVVLCLVVCNKYGVNLEIIIAVKG